MLIGSFLLMRGTGFPYSKGTGGEFHGLMQTPERPKKLVVSVCLR